MTPDQFHLFARGSWLPIWLIADFEGTRPKVVASQGGGTLFALDGRRGHYATTARGLEAAVGGQVVTTLTWAEVRAWAQSLPPAAIARAAELGRAGREHQAVWPNYYPSIGRAYCWDARDERHVEPDCGQCVTDRAALTAAQVVRDAEREVWVRGLDAHLVAVRTFLDSLAPSDEPAEPSDLLELLAATA